MPGTDIVPPQMEQTPVLRFLSSGLLLELTAGILWDVVEMAVHVGAEAPEFSWADQCEASRPRVLCPSTLGTRGHTPSPPFLACLDKPWHPFS